MKKTYSKAKIFSITYIAISIVFFVILAINKANIFPYDLNISESINLILQIVFLLSSATISITLFSLIIKNIKMKNKGINKVKEILNNKTVMAGIIVFFINFQIQTGFASFSFLSALNSDFFSIKEFKTIYLVEVSAFILTLLSMIVLALVLLTLNNFNNSIKNISMDNSAFIIKRILDTINYINTFIKSNFKKLIKELISFINSDTLDQEYLCVELNIKSIENKKNKIELNTTIQPCPQF